MKNYSTTYTNEIIKVLGVVALIFKFDLPDETEAIVGALLVLGGALWTMYNRYKAGQSGIQREVSVLGVRKSS